MSDLDLEAHLVALADEMRKLIAENFAKPPNEKVHKRLREIREEIHRHGWAVIWSAGINPETLALTAEVQLWKPKKDLSPEDQKIYDEWFSRMNNIKKSE
jgi:isochorismate hydrolase